MAFRILHFCVIGTGIAILFTNTIFAQQVSHASHIESLKDKISSDGVLVSGKSVSAIRCADKCVASQGCSSFFYNKETKYCQTHNKTLDATNLSLKTMTGFKYYVLPGEKVERIVTYLGCYKDPHPFQDWSHIEMMRSTLSKDTCVDYCFQKGYKYCGLEFGIFCTCDDSFGQFGVLTEDKCNKACPAEPLRMCGGTNANSVYSTGL